MTIRSAFTFLGLSLALACGGGGGGGGSAPNPAPAGPPPNTVWVGGSDGYGGATVTFQPAILTVPAGTTVTWAWQGGSHNVTSYTLSGSPTFTGSSTQSGGTYTFKFTAPGTYYYYCNLHGNFFGTFPNATQEATGMAGKIVVQ